MKKSVVFWRGICFVLILVSSISIQSQANAASIYHQPYESAASSCVHGVNCPVPQWHHSLLIDSNPSTAWSSQIHHDSTGYEWFAFWFADSDTDFIKLVPRLVTGQALHVPETINIYYSANGRWNFIKSAALPAYMDPNGHIINFNKVHGNGILVTSDKLRPSDGNYYFQMAEMYAGLAKPTKSLQYYGFACDVYGDQKIQVLNNDAENLAYDFNVTRLSNDSYLAVFHAEPYLKGNNCWGDSIAMRYATGPDAFFGERTGLNPGDYVATRTSNNSHYMYSNSCNTDMNSSSGAANPILIKRGEGVTPPFVLYYLSVSDYNGSYHDDYWRHYLMVSNPMDINNVHNTTWASLANQGQGDYYHWFTDGNALIYRNYFPSPAREDSSPSYPLLHSELESYCANDAACATHGLIGNMTKGNDGKIYFFYADVAGIEAGQGIKWDGTNGTGVTLRREMKNSTAVNLWTAPLLVRQHAWWKVAYHATLNRWMVLSECWVNGKRDMCLQFTSSSNINEISNLNLATHRLELVNYFNNGGQGVSWNPGLLKNEYGQIPSNDFRLYFNDDTDNNVHNSDVYAIRVNCHPTN